MKLKTHTLYISRGDEGEKVHKGRLRYLVKNPNKNDDVFTFLCVLTGNTYKQNGQFLRIEGDTSIHDIVKEAPVIHGQEFDLETMNGEKFHVVAVELDGEVRLYKEHKVYDKDGYRWMK